MMKLFISPGACSMSCHITLEEAGMKFETVVLDFDKEDSNWKELNKLNALGAVPVLVTDNGKVITQNATIMEYVANLNPNSNLLPKVGTQEHTDTMQWLTFVSADLHKGLGMMFGIDHMTTNEAARVEIKNFALENVNKYFAHIDSNLQGKDYITGKNFTIADSYLFTIVGWTKWLNINIDQYRNLGAFMSRVYQRPAVQKVMKAEGLLN